ncbi:phytoene desaturase family protein [Georgenia sp. 10Sc9-8]|uniref:Phytoene desaturase family protein n=1 Tax=Georgenia halotolerans TaxID=3028317 RepID=A0ABT5TWG0_9MICO|nr:phytoene desaturase family protein [Georgenia halotolerans]
MSRVVVVGAGVAGLATAALLAREGHEVTVLEAQEELGGRAGLWEADGFRFDTGPSWYLMPEVFDHFFRLLGTSAADQLDLERLDPAYRVFPEGRPPVDVRSDRADAVALFESVEPGAGARLSSYLDSAAEVYELAKEYFLYTTFASLLPLATPGVLARLPRLARLLTESLEARVARDFQDVRLRQVLGYPAVFLGSSPALTPSMYHLMSHLDLTEGVLYPRRGLVEVVRALARQVTAHGATVVTRARVGAITTRPRAGGLPAGPRAVVTGVGYEDAAGRRRHVPADVVVSTADLHHTETELLPPSLRTFPERWWRRRVPGPSAVMVYLGVEGRLPELEHHSLFFTEDWRTGFDRIFTDDAGVAPAPFPSPTSLYVSRPSATDATVAPPGSEALIVLVPVPPDPGLGRGGRDGRGDAWVEAVADAAIDQVAGWAGVADLRDRIHVRRTMGPGDYAAELSSWRGTALGPAHTLAQSAMFRAGNRSRKVAGLLYAGGSVIPGIGLPMCLISAELVVKRLRGDVSTTALPEPL